MQTSFTPYFPIGYSGMPADLDSPKYDRSYFNTALDIAGIVTVTVVTYVASTQYSLTINGVIITTRSPATGGTITSVRDDLVAAVNQSLAGVDAVATATAGAFSVVGLPGQPLTVTAGNPELTAVVTTPFSASTDIGLGLAVVRLATDSDREVRLGAPDASHKFVGITVDDGLRTNAAPYGASDHVYRRTDVMLVREMGVLWVAIEGPPVTPSSPVFYRYSGAGKIGAFRGAPTAGADLQLTNAQFLTSGSDLVQIKIGYGNIIAPPGTTV